MIKFDKLLTRLEMRGFTTYRIKKEYVMGQATYAAIKSGRGGIDTKTIDRLCRILECQPGDLMEYVPDEEEP